MSFINLDSIRKRVVDSAQKDAALAADATAAVILYLAKTTGEGQLQIIFKSVGFSAINLQ